MNPILKAALVTLAVISSFFVLGGLTALVSDCDAECEASRVTATTRPVGPKQVDTREPTCDPSPRGCW